MRVYHRSSGSRARHKGQGGLCKWIIYQRTKK
nr:MAG TPA: hypothetical protein [Caudoviricetes sp.]